ncbi:MAG: FtsX-like permease family protein [Alphaproteobacteria bacterium]|nr:FtsX-like permease family protein [Alphaproteobacteria bacterium]
MRLPLALLIARRELRAGLSGFRVFLLCLALGVAAIAGVGTLKAALLAGLAADARLLVGGDVELRLTHRPASAEQLEYLAEAGVVAHSIEMRAMARVGDERRALVEVKAVDAAYPLYGALSLEPADARLGPAATDLPPAFAEPGLLRRLQLEPGGVLTIGKQDYRVVARLLREPDRGADGVEFGPRLMLPLEGFAATGLVQEGSLIRFVYKLKLSQDRTVGSFLRQLSTRFPDAGWRIRDSAADAPGMRGFIERLHLFMTLVGLTTLLVGGVGIANAIKSYLDGKVATIATLKCLGAPGGLVFASYLAQVLVLAGLGVLAGLALGALLPVLLSGALAGLLPFQARLGLYWQPLALAAAFGILTTLAFAVWPLARAREVPAAALFRSLLLPPARLPRPRYVLGVGLALAALIGLAVASADDRPFALWFVGGAAGAFVLFYAAGRLATWSARAAGRPRLPALRLALANLHRPGAATVGVLLSFGLGLSVLVAVAQIQGNLAAQVRDRLPAQAPAFFFVDIQPDQIDEFRAIAAGLPGTGETVAVPSLRGRIVAVNGVPAGQVAVKPDGAWALRGDRGLTYAATPPDGAEIVAGRWWPADYAGPPLVSFDAGVAAALGVGVGDRLTVNVLGRDIEARIASLRRIDWSTLGMNFAIVFAPGLLEAAPHSFIATAKAADGAEGALEAAVVNRFPNVSAIRVKDALEAANRILANVGLAVRVTAAVTLLAGLLVLAGAIAAGHRRRVYDAVVLKVLGATRAVVMRTNALEFLLLGGFATLLATAVGSLAAFVVVTHVMHQPWLFLPATMAATALGGLAATLVLGFLGTLRALAQRPTPLLRNA